MKTRRIVYDDKTNMYKVVWFGSIGFTQNLSEDGKELERHKIPQENYLDVKIDDIESIKEYKKQEVVMMLSTLRGELKHSPNFGFRGLLTKYPKELLDIEILDILRNQAGLLVSSFNSTKKDREYSVEFVASTPSGISIDMSYAYSYEV